ncbi:ferrochelatase [Dactylococcopsis salina]|uniref:coproporphyrin ferrochelatase n=1 Tax=Dactylococcopsis salina (strain PCC 8305) TaxID=13035 RepID=K9Z0W2_DACS8|nr:ferrochelatase [Dactylococcopsis salina]AFZ52018.1 protoheme ferro-lyase (ferrochelatase) [Dactylococcopsis salina PCC 8305]
MVATPEKIQQTSQINTNGDDRVAVLLMGYGEVESYDDFANYNEQALNLLTAKFAPVPTWMYPPVAKLLAMFDLHEWSHQHGNFISPHNKIFEAQREGIEQELRKNWGEKVSVFKAFNFCKPYLPNQVLAQIKEQGYNKILIYPLLVVDSIFTSGIAVEQVNEALRELNSGEEQWVTGMRYIPSFYNQPDYINLMARLVEEKIQSELSDAYLPSEIGIVLMNHGCPHEAKGFTSGIMESEALYESVREQLINKYPLISVGWLNHDTPLIEWTQPNADLAAKNIIELGAKAVVMMPIGFATENHETILDVDHIIHDVKRKYKDVNFVQMACANDHPEFLKMAANWADEQIEALLSETVTVVNPQLAQEKATHGHSHDHSHDHDGHHHHHH